MALQNKRFLARTDAFKKIELEKRFNAMEREADTYQASYKSLKTYIYPTRGQFGDSKVERGKMIDHQTLLDDHATDDVKILGSGLSSGTTSKLRPWFRTTLEDKELAKRNDVRQWLDELEKRMYSIIDKSNSYGTFQSIYEELGTFGTGCFIVLEDFEDTIRCRGFTAGEYFLSTDKKGRVNAFARKFYMTVGQMVDQFGIENVSPSVKSQYEQNQIEQYVQVQHMIEVNDKRIPGFVDARNMKYRSVYWERGNKTEQFLAIRGYNIFPVVAPRWETITTDFVYGYGPGWYALGDVKQLQKTALDKLVHQEKFHNPPVQEDASVESSSYIPGGVSKTSGQVPNAGVRAAYQVDLKLESFIEAESKLYNRIDKKFFTNLFLMLVNIDKKNMTATEIAERQQEKIMMMGPILHLLDEEMHAPYIEILYSIMLENGLVPDPPEDIGGQEIRIQYISILAQAQRAIGITPIERVIGLAANIHAGFPDAPNPSDNLDLDEVIREAAEMEGCPASASA